MVGAGSDETDARDEAARFTVVDLFSGGGGMSWGFHAHPRFRVVGAVDAQVGKPSQRAGSLECNRTYELNIGVRPVVADLARVPAAQLRDALALAAPLDVLTACPPCTGFTRTRPGNHLLDDTRNHLVGRIADFARVLRPRVIVLENARELLTGNFVHHFAALTTALTRLGYETSARTHLLTRFGLPQIRERALVVAVQRGLQPHGLDELWAGRRVDPAALTVRRAIGALPAVGAGEADPHDPVHVAPAFRDERARLRTRAIPRDGGSWRSLIGGPGTEAHLTPAMRRSIAAGRLGSYPDVYGRMWWDRPAPTIKRECTHVGNGRYTHPEQDRLLTVREVALLNGFPATYRFGGRSIANHYRHVGDAVPPLISYQLAAVVAWTLTGQQPALADAMLPGARLVAADIVDDVPDAA